MVTLDRELCRPFVLFAPTPLCQAALNYASDIFGPGKEDLAQAMSPSHRLPGAELKVGQVHDAMQNTN
jgi:hypothetical protein